MKKTKIYFFLLTISFLLLVGIAFINWVSRSFHETKELNIYTNAYTAENVYKWLVGSGLIDPALKQVKTNEPLPRGVKSRILLENRVRIVEYTVDQKTKNTYPVHASTYTVSFKNITVSMPKETGNPVDVERVLIEQQPVPNISKKSY